MEEQNNTKSISIEQTKQRYDLHSMKYKIICVSGKIGVGKDFIATNVIKSYLEKKGCRILILALADHFKIEAVAKEGLPYKDVFFEKTKESRKILQKKGTEEGRAVFGDSIWINHLLTTMRLHHERSGIDVFIVTDCRFKNEVFHFKESGALVIRINAPIRNHNRLSKESNGDPEIYNSIKNHVSETDLDDYDGFDFIYENDDNYFEEIQSKQNVIFHKRLLQFY